MPVMTEIRTSPPRPETPRATHHKFLPAVVKGIDRAKRELLLLVSHELVDADKELVVQAGISWARWDLNPQVFLQHDRFTDIGFGLPLSRRIEQIGGAPATVLKVRLFPEGMEPEADQLYAKLQAGGACGVSIGFLPIEQAPPRLAGQTGPTWTKIEILEVSLVTLPSCPTCVVLEKSRGAGGVAVFDGDLNLLNQNILAVVAGCLRDTILAEALKAVRAGIFAANGNLDWYDEPEQVVSRKSKRRR